MNNQTNSQQFGFSRTQGSSAAAGADKGGSLKQTLCRLEVSSPAR